MNQNETEILPATMAAALTHTLDEDFQHFLSYTVNVAADERLRRAYEDGNERGLLHGRPN